jgi:hypothetical protein
MNSQARWLNQKVETERRRNDNAEKEIRKMLEIKELLV